MLAWLLALASFAPPARASCHDDPVLVAEASEADAATGAAVRTLLGEPEGSPGWRLSLEGGRAEIHHARLGERYARSLPLDSSAYDRALAAIELLVAARAACTDRAMVPEAEPAPVATASPISLGIALLGRFDGEVDGPWLVRPSLAVELGFARSGADPSPFVGLEVAALGVFGRAASQDRAVRYERHDLVLRAGVQIPVDRLTLFLSGSAGVTLRDVSGTDDGVPAAHRLDVGAVLGAEAQLRVTLVGPLGLRLAGGLSFLPEAITYRGSGAPVITEQFVRVWAALGLDVELR